MKRMISAIAVIAIVSSALAFKPNFVRKFCASQTPNSGCSVIFKKIGSGTNNFFEYHIWDGTDANCVSTRCADPINLILD